MAARLLLLGLAGTVDALLDFWCVYLFGGAQQKIIRGLRIDLFRTILRQDIGFFDLEENASGVLAARLATDAAAIRGAVADVAGVAASNMTTMLFAFLVAFIASWKMSLILTATLPLLGMAGYLQNLSITGFGANQDQVFVNRLVGSHVC